MLGVRGALLRLLGLAGNIVLARLLLPRDFGAVAFGFSLMTFVALFSGAGLGAGLIRKREPPVKEDLEALLGIQLLATSGLALLVALTAWPFGIAGKVTAVMVATTPLTTLRTPGAILLERELSYRPLVVVELWEQLAFYGWAIASVAIGWGVWGFATAAIPRAVVGVAVMLKVAPIGLLRPRVSWHRVKTLVRFGAQYQAVALISLVRDQGLNVGTAAISGIPTLGLWSLASRIMQLPFLLFESLWRVSFPAVSRLLAKGEKARSLLERGVGLSAVGTGSLLAPLVGGGPELVPLIFGPQWSQAAVVLPWAALGLMISGPISVASSGYLYAVGDASVVFRGELAATMVWMVVAFSLLGRLGVVALGIGWLCGSCVEALALGRPASKRSDASVLSILGIPTGSAVAGAVLGWLVGSLGLRGWLSVALGVFVAEGVYLTLLFLLRRALLVDTVRLGWRALRLASRSSA